MEGGDHPLQVCNVFTLGSQNCVVIVGRVEVREVQGDVCREVQGDVCREVGLDFHCQLVMEVGTFSFEPSPGDQANLRKGGDVMSGHIWEHGAGGGCCDDGVRQVSSTVLVDRSGSGVCVCLFITHSATGSVLPGGCSRCGGQGCTTSAADITVFAR